MKYAVNIAAVVLLGWPALMLGYAWAAIRAGWSTGSFLYNRHEDAAIAKFVDKKEG